MAPVVGYVFRGIPPHDLIGRGTKDYIGLTLMVIWLLGLAVAWKWELAGGLLTLAAILISASFINCGVLEGLGILPPIAALLFVLCWGMSGQAQQEKRD